MQDPQFLKYVEYFKRKPRARQYYFLVGSGKTKTAKGVSERCKRSIQTATNALRDLERIGLLKSTKEGRTRTYELRDPRLFQGLISSIDPRPTKTASEDIVSATIFGQNLEKWMEYIAEILEGTLYVDPVIHTRILDPIQVDYVIENQIGQILIMFHIINDERSLESATGKLFSLITSRDLNPNLRLIFSVVLVKTVDYKTQQGTNANRMKNKIRSTFDGLRRINWNDQGVEGVHTSYRIEDIQPGELVKAEFAEKLSRRIVEGIPVYSEEALPGDDWLDIPTRRERALRAVQYKLKQDKIRRYRVSVAVIGFNDGLREIFPRDIALSKVLDSENLLRSYGLKEDDVFVDVGCSDGLFTIPAAKIVGEKGKVYGIEISSVALEKVSTHIAETKLENVILNNSFPENVMLGERMADIVLFGVALYDMYNPIKALKNAHSMLKDSGRLIVLEWQKGSTETGPVELYRFRKEKIIAFLEYSGFKIETIKDEGEQLYSIVATVLHNSPPS